MAAMDVMRMRVARGTGAGVRYRRWSLPCDATTLHLAGDHDWNALAADISRWGRELGFAEIGIADTDLGSDEARLLDWLAAGRHGAMDYMARHGTRRARPAELVPNTLRVITARMNYLPPEARDGNEVLANPARAFVARYALGRDYHKVLRTKLQTLAGRIRAAAGGGAVPRVHRQRPRARSRAGGEVRHRLARQAHAAAHARARLVVLSRRDLHRPAAAADAGGIGALRDLHRVHRRMPDRRDRRSRTSSMRAAAFPT